MDFILTLILFRYSRKSSWSEWIFNVGTGPLNALVSCQIFSEADGDFQRTYKSRLVGIGNKILKDWDLEDAFIARKFVLLEYLH